MSINILLKHTWVDLSPDGTFWVRLDTGSAVASCTTRHEAEEIVRQLDTFVATDRCDGCGATGDLHSVGGSTLCLKHTYIGAL